MLAIDVERGGSGKVELLHRLISSGFEGIEARLVLESGVKALLGEAMLKGDLFQRRLRCFRCRPLFLGLEEGLNQVEIGCLGAGIG